jgi:glucose/arabinose dehydrogenase
LTTLTPARLARRFGCDTQVYPPSWTWTTETGEELVVVLAEGDLAAVTIGGRFEAPWSIGLLPDGSFLVTERPGPLQHVRSSSSTSEVAGAPKVLYMGHGGLLDVAVDPDFAHTDLLYLSSLYRDEQTSTVRVIRAKFDESNDALSEQQLLFVSSPGPTPEMIVGRLALTGDGYLFLSLGDRWEGSRAQDFSDTAGSIVRIKTDGSVPEGNPFFYDPGTRAEIWSYGHRNPGTRLQPRHRPTLGT